MASSLLPRGSAGFLLAARILESGRQERARQYQHRATTRMRLSEYLTTLMLPPTARLDNQPPQRPRRLHSTQLWVLLKYDPTGARSPGCPDRPAAQEEGPAGLSRWSCSSLDSQRTREMWVRSIVQAPADIIVDLGPGAHRLPGSSVPHLVSRRSSALPSEPIPAVTAGVAVAVNVA